MSFVFYDLTFLAIFCILLAIFLYSKRKKLKREGILILYRTEIGIKIIKYISKKYKKVLDFFNYVLIFFGYIAMGAMLFLIFQLLYLFLKNPEIIRAIKIPPIAPLIPYLPQIFKADYLPMFYFTYWIIALAITAISHEFLHGVFFKMEGIKIKSTGFAFLGPFLAFFVEPDEKKVKKAKIRKQLAAIAAGSFANLIMTLLFFLVMWLFFVFAFTQAGVVFGTYSFSVINTSSIEKIGNDTLFINLNEDLNLTNIIANNTAYYIDQETAIKIENQSIKDSLIFAYDDAPALKVGLKGVIIELAGEKIKNDADLKNALMEKNPGDKIIIKTMLNNLIKEFEIKLIARADNKSQAYLGITTLDFEKGGIIQKIRSKLVFFKKPNTYYKPKNFEDFTIFTYYLIWWIVLINLSVALGNMLPLGIFDGGRFFYLSILALSKSEKIAKKAYKFSTIVLLLVFALLTILWLFSFR